MSFSTKCKRYIFFSVLKKMSHLFAMDEDFVTLESNDTCDDTFTEENEQNLRLHQTLRKKLLTRHDKTKHLLNLKQEIALLRKENTLLKTIYGINSCPLIIKDIVHIQARTRGWILRKDKCVFNAAVITFLNWCNMIVQRRKFLSKKHAIIVVQSFNRGKKIRQSTIGRAISRLIYYKRDLCDYHATLSFLGPFRYTYSDVASSLDRNQFLID
jgi:hypothetical protein